MALLDDNVLLLVVALPLLGALFGLVMPAVDRLGLRYVGMATSIASGLLGLRAVLVLDHAGAHTERVLGATLRLDGLSAPLLLVVGGLAPMALRAGAPRVQERTQMYVVTALFAHALAVLGVLLDAPLLMLATAPIAAVPLFALVALYGGPLRGTTTFRSVIIWLSVDAVALAALAFVAARADAPIADLHGAALARAAAALDPMVRALLFLALAAPGLVRLAAGPFSVWLLGTLEEAPVSAAVLVLGAAGPLGFHIVSRVAVPVAHGDVLLPVIVLVAVLAAIASGLIALAERDGRRLIVQLVQVNGALCATAALSSSTIASGALAAAAVQVALASAWGSLSLMALEAIERRFESRDALELAGGGRHAPFLCTLFVVGLFGLAGLPVFGHSGYYGTVLAVVRALGDDPLPPLRALWVATAFVAASLLMMIGVAGVARRLFLPLRERRAAAPLAVTFSQALRLLAPLTLVVLGSLTAPTLLAATRAALPALATPTQAMQPTPPPTLDDGGAP